MDDTYLVEIRLARTRWRIKETTRAIARQFGVERYQEQHPHVTLYGPFTLDDPAREQHLLDTVAACAARFRTIAFIVGGWERRDGVHGGVVAFSINPSPELADLVATLARTLSGFTLSLNPWDQQPDRKWHHSTIANSLPPEKSGEIINGLSDLPGQEPRGPLPGSIMAALRAYRVALSGLLRGGTCQSIRPVLLDDAGLRITVMHNDDILGEYDLSGQRWLAAEEIHDPRSWQESMARYRKEAGFELSVPVPHTPVEIFLISDLHLGHANIIRYCSRPFVYPEISEMDRVLVNNWNYCVSAHDRAYFLGDLRYGKDARPAAQYRALLNGDITFVGGNHDGGERCTVSSARITCDGMEFLLVHDPEDVPAGYSGWVIHGHHHNNDLCAFPYIDPAGKRINVSAEVVGYCPVSLHEICRTLREQAVPSGEPLLLRYPYVRSHDGTGLKRANG